MSDHRMRVSEDRPQYSHIPIPLIKAMRDGIVSFPAVAMYAALDAYRDRQTQSCFPSYRRLAVDIGMSLTTVHRLVRELSLAGFIRIDQPVNPSRPAVFVLLFSPPPRAKGVPKTERAFHSCSPSLSVNPPDTTRGKGSRSVPYNYSDPRSENQENHALQRDNDGLGEDPKQTTFAEAKLRSLLDQRKRAMT